ncbi:MAG: sialidase family protein [Dehalococcoidia bacterium]
MNARLPLVLAAALLTLALSSAGPAPRASAAPPITFHCTLDANCPAITIAGDPYATLGGNPAPFRGYGDPSLEYDPMTGTLWLSYSWLDVLVSDPNPPPQIDLGVRTHLASSTDNGDTWTFTNALNATTVISHPDTSTQGWTQHEVSSLLREGPGSWQAMWLDYFDPLGEPAGPEDRSDFYYTRSLASTRAGLDASPVPWARGSGTSPSFGAVHNLSLIPQLSDCAAFTEPALFTDGYVTYLATNCVVFSGGVRQDDEERLILLRQETNGYSYVGSLLTYADAVDLGATRIEQGDIAYTQDGGIILIVTPIVSGGTPEHHGCVVFEISDLASAEVYRDASGDAVPLALISGDDPTFGPGACTYDPASETGILMHVHDYTASPFAMEFSVRETGVHPLADTDSDGWTNAREATIGTDADAPCGFTPGGDPASGSWPADLVESDNVNISDVLSLKPVFGSVVPPASARYDIVPSGAINIQDVLRLKPPFGASCTP